MGKILFWDPTIIASYPKDNWFWGFFLKKSSNHVNGKQSAENSWSIFF